MSARHGDPDWEANDPNDLNHSAADEKPEGDGPWLPAFWPEPKPESDCTPGENEYDREELANLTLAIGLLSGAWDGAAKRYLSGADEKRARKALGRLLRNGKPLDSLLRYQLAELFDHEPPHLSFENAPMEREIVFGFRRSGKPRDVTLRNLHLVSDYYRSLVEQGEPRKTAVAQVCKKYSVSDTAVKEALRRNPSLKPKAVKKRINRPG
jgi:hypothetical protein